MYIYHKFQGGGGHILEGMGVCSVKYSLLFCHDDGQKKKQENLNKKLMARKPKGSHWQWFQ